MADVKIQISKKKIDSKTSKKTIDSKGSKKTLESKKEKAKEEAARKASAAKAELERQQAEAAAALIAAEEARLAEEKLRAEEEERFKRSTFRNQTSDDENIKDLYKWLQSIPFSRGPFGKLERDFSDGTLVAEVINYYCPHLCNMQQYFPWYSSVNKISNWTLLNWQVLPKLGIRLNPSQIYSLMNPFSCGKFEGNCHKKFIYTLLQNMKDALVERNSKVNDYKKKNFISPKFPDKPQKFTMFKRLKSDKSMPTFSKVEMLIENGFYDTDKKSENEADRPSEPSRQFSFTDVESSSCPRLTKRYTTVEDEATIFIRPSVTYCLKPKASMTFQPCNARIF